ncbi:hypothetical protein [Streptomyces minutiscleroticus]|uniref:Uncharacterized protein n=1 Tax=Streptomyces minutiscleroticus TaxID=68238 RepID=A0A918NRI6_9ACTN|nr:hypothetical protein [Streptomyces minutiscleroticus]GGX89496.1 hypothetical protein GCM10010358_49300 [Streptomyces minutiscleroticus]
MYLARGFDDGSTWPWVLGVLALYVLMSYGLEYRARRRRGSRHAARAALHDLGDRNSSAQEPAQHLTSRLIMSGGALATGLVAFFASGVLRVVAAVLVALVAVAAWAYYDYRTEPRYSRNG